MPNGARHYAFTLNNYTEDDINNLEQAVDSGRAVFVIFGKEVASTGTPHLQGHVSFSKQTSIKGAKKSLGVEAHFSMVRNLQRSIEYCKKEGDFREFGVPPATSGSGQPSTETNELRAFRETVIQGCTDLAQLRETHPNVMARYPRFALSVIRDLRPKIPVQNHDLHDWQRSLLEYTSREPDPRKIVFCIDPKGNSGKTYICDYLEFHFDHVQIMKPSKAADMAFEYDENTKILCIDVPRSKMSQFEYMYSFLESIKDGRLFSPKYESWTKRFKTPHVIVFMNEEPDMNALSEDRYEMIYI